MPEVDTSTLVLWVLVIMVFKAVPQSRAPGGFDEVARVGRQLPQIAYSHVEAWQGDRSCCECNEHNSSSRITALGGWIGV